MTRKKHNPRSLRQGFSLIELTVVMSIIVVLYAVISPVVFRARMRAGETACASNLHLCYLALQMYKQDYGDFPDYRPVDQMTSTYITSPAIAVCPVEFRNLAAVDPSDPGAKAHYPTSYMWPCMPSRDRDATYERRHDLTPLVICDLHIAKPAGEPTYLLVRWEGTVSRVRKKVADDVLSTNDL